MISARDKTLLCCESVVACRISPLKRGFSTKRLVDSTIKSIALVLAAALLLVWVVWWRAFAENDRLNLLEFAFGVSGHWLQWILDVCFGLSLAAFVYVAVVVAAVVGVVHLRRTKRDRVGVVFVAACHFAVAVVCLFFSLSVMGFVSSVYFKGWATLKLKLISSAILLHITLIVGFTLALGLTLQILVIRIYEKDSRRVSAWLYVETALLSVSLICVDVLPFALAGNPSWLPCVTAAAPAKPKLNGHRGSPTLAPENTRLSFRIAAERGSSGFESDLQISKDGELFMFHDDNLKRTTDVARVFPRFKEETFSFFNSSQIRQLNAGKWFVDRDPSSTLSSGSVSPYSIAEMQNQTILTFRQFLLLAKEKDQDVLWDFKHPDSDDAFLQKVLDVIAEVGVDPRHVWLNAEESWFPFGSGNFSNVRSNFRWTVFEKNDDLVDDLSYFLRRNLTHRNIHFGRAFPSTLMSQFARHNVTSNVWVPNAPWMFSLLWCQGLTESVTTNRVDAFAAMERPLGMLSPGAHSLLFGTVVGASLIFLVGVVGATLGCLKTRSEFEEPEVVALTSM